MQGSGSKKIELEGVDKGITQMYDRLRNTTRQLGEEMIRDARRYSQTGREQLAYIEDQIKAIERRNRVEREGLEYQARMRLEQTGDKAAFKKEISNISSSGAEDKTQITLLRELIETVKLTSREEIFTDKRKVQQEVGDQKSLLGLITSSKRFDGDDELENLKRYLQKDELGTGQSVASKKERGILGSILGASAFQSAIGALNQAPGARDEEQLIGGLLSGLPFGLGVLGGAFSRSRQEQLAAQQSGLKLSGLTGQSGGISSMNAYGMSQAETNQYAQSLFSSAGTSSINVQDAIAAERAFSLDSSVIQERAQVGRFSSGPDQFLNEIASLLRASGLKEDRVLFGEVLRNQTQLIQDFSQTAQVVNQQSATNAITSLSRLGGSFSMGDPRSLQRIRTINQSLSNPQNDIARAENISILRQMNPDAGLFDILEMESQGAQNMDFLRGIIGNASSRFGDTSSQSSMLYLRERLGLDFSSTRQFAENADKIMSGDMSEKEIEALMSTNQIRSEGRSRTAELDVSAASISDAFVKGSKEGMMEVIKLTGEELGKSIKNSLQTLGVIDDEQVSVPTPNLPIPGTNFMIDIMKQATKLYGKFSEQ